MGKFLDPNLKFKRKTVEQKIQLIEINGESLPLPTEIEISESETCNRKCSFCPRSDPNFVDRKEFISNELFEKLCSELVNFSYSGTIRFSGFVEPLLDKNIYNLICKARTNLQFVNIELVTNGDPLNAERLIKLFEKGLNKILISVYDSEEDYFKFLKMCKEIGLNKSQYIVRKRYLSSSDNFGIALSNRAGSMENAEYKIKKLNEPLKSHCYIPSYTFFLDYQGDVLMCPHDWGEKIILGNLNLKNLYQIWFSKKAINIRKILKNGNRNFSPCNVCDVEGTLMGQKNAEYFS
tara:strand:- start:1195 stop:2073 length:879 start_codon:yes stop_codon:yes gene_type:complete